MIPWWISLTFLKYKEKSVFNIEEYFLKVDKVKTVHSWRNALSLLGCKIFSIKEKMRAGDLI